MATGIATIIAATAFSAASAATPAPPATDAAAAAAAGLATASGAQLVGIVNAIVPVAQSTLPEVMVHVLLVVPPILGLIWTAFMFHRVYEVEIEVEEDESDDEDGKLMAQQAMAEGGVCYEMSRLQKIIADGATTFLFVEYMYMAVYVVVFSLLIVLFYSVTGQTTKAVVCTTIAFIVGAVTSILSGYIGMKAAVDSNARTTFKCWEAVQHSTDPTEQNAADGLLVALQGGSIMGFGLCSIGVLVLYGLIMIYRMDFCFGSDTWEGAKGLCESLAGFGLGGSSIALFGRVGGGIYTKAADVGADLSGKNEYGMEEDDPRNPACIADNVGDNVGDIAGMGADLFGSFAESTVAALVIASGSEISMNFSALLFPLLISSSGIVVGIITLGVIMMFLDKIATDYAGIENALKLLLVVSTVLQTPVVILLGFISLPETFILPSGQDTMSVTNTGCIICILLGLWSGLIIGLVTEYYTSHTYTPVREIAKSQVQSASTGIIYGLALGYLSCIIPVVLIAIIVVVAHTLCGMYGVALGALGMLSTLTIGLTIDGYGPISDNAGGIAEMSGCGEKVRECTDALDAAGNTTAAIGKGFAIGSAALVALALFGAFKERAEIQHVDVADSWTFAGLLIGALLPYWFSAMTMKSVAVAADDMVKECMRQFPKIINEGVKPDYERCIKISTQASLREMIAPGLLVILSPLVMGLAFGKNCTAGLLVGSLVSGVQLAISMSNSGGAWDNSKKFIKADGLEKEELWDRKKGEEPIKKFQTEEDKKIKKINPKWDAAHKNSVTGDTVGDPLKDTSGPSLNILVKLSAITSLVFASVVNHFSNSEGGPAWLAVQTVS